MVKMAGWTNVWTLLPNLQEWAVTAKDGERHWQVQGAMGLVKRQEQEPGGVLRAPSMTIELSRKNVEQCKFRLGSRSSKVASCNS